MLTLDALRLDTDGWPLALDERTRRAWRLPNGDAVAVEVIERPPELRTQTITTLRDQYRDGARQAGAALISAEVIRAGGQPCVRAVLKLPTPTGMAYVASATWPFREASLVVKVQSSEQGATGVREAALLPSFRSAHPAVDFTARPNAWMHDPYRPELADAFMRTVADDEKYDAVFPDHPLSRAREILARLIERAQLDEAVVSTLMPLALPEPA